ncbi:MAG: hypothetical protein ACRDRL_18765, partial [Sciscionella sp.]
MTFRDRLVVGKRAAFGVAAAGAALLVGATAPQAVAVTAFSPSAPAGFSVRTIATAPAGLSEPDDVTRLGGHLFVAYQNGVGSKGEAAKTGGIHSAVVEYTLGGKTLHRWNMIGKIDGMTADRAHRRIVATVNEDGNSSLYTIDRGGVQHYQYEPAPLPHGGGTDSVAFVHGRMFVTASAPSADANGTTYSKPALYQVTLRGKTAHATPVFFDNAAATDLHTGQQSRLNLSDPDSGMRVPGCVPTVGNRFLLDSQGDSQLVFIRQLGTKHSSASVLNLDHQVDDTAFATSNSGTLYVVDNQDNRILAVQGGFHRGEAFSSTTGGTVGRLNLTTGTITPFITGLGSPHGLL